VGTILRVKKVLKSGMNHLKKSPEVEVGGGEGGRRVEK
jgi:hypothetical protein